MFVQKRRSRIRANEDVMVTPEATDLLFEAEDVAELVAEVTGEEVQVDADDTVVTFAVGEEEYTVEAEGDEEVLESVRKPMRGKASVKANHRTARRPVRASRSARTLRKVPRRRR